MIPLIRMQLADTVLDEVFGKDNYSHEYIGKYVEVEATLDEDKNLNEVTFYLSGCKLHWPEKYLCDIALEIEKLSDDLLCDRSSEIDEDLEFLDRHLH